MTRRTGSAASKALAVLCLLVCCPCCFPCYIGLIRSNRKRQRRDGLAAQRARATGSENPHSPCDVHPLPSRRRRLSVSAVVEPLALQEVDDNGQTIMEEPNRGLDADQAYSTQEQCQLFSKLPLELRHMIYEHCLSGYQIYLAVDADNLRLGNVKFLKSFGGIRFVEEWRENRVHDVKLLPLLQTCRRIYTEATPFLYSKNSFVATKTTALLSLTSSLRLNRFNAITTLTFGWTVPGPKPLPMFEHICSVVASMKGLRRLHVKLWPHRRLVSHRQELERMLAALKKVTRPVSFTVNIVASPLDDLELGETPYELQWSLFPWET